MRNTFTENDYGNIAMAPGTWVTLRPDSNASNPLGFLNHFGKSPTGSEWDRNDKKTILKHASDFKLKYKRYPTFISLDYINWSDANNGPIKVLEDLYF